MGLHFIKNGTKHDVCVKRPSLFPASATTYDNSNSGLSANRVQGAVDELANPTFTEASTRANIASGDSFSTILGKIKKFFTDLKTVAFTGAYSDLSGTENVAVKNDDNQFSVNQSISTSESYSKMVLGNANSDGLIDIIHGNSKASLYSDILTGNRLIKLPDKSGTIALTSDLTWNYVSTTIITDTTAGTIAIPSGVKELLVSVGSNNNGQVFGGKTFVMQYTQPGYDIIVTGELINGSGTTVSTKGVYIGYNNATSLSYKALDIVSGKTLAVRIYYR